MFIFALLLGVIFFVFFMTMYFKGLFSDSNSNSDSSNKNEEIEVLDVSD